MTSPTVFGFPGAGPATMIAMSRRIELGRRGEALASAYLVGAGYRIVETNWRCPLGELDIVAALPRLIVFVEVKTRIGLGAGHPFCSIGPQKLDRLYRLSAAWRRAHATSAPFRVDVIGILLPPHGPHQIEHLEGVSW